MTVGGQKWHRQGKECVGQSARSGFVESFWLERLNTVHIQLLLNAVSFITVLPLWLSVELQLLNIYWIFSL